MNITVYGWLYESGITDATSRGLDANNLVKAQVGYGSATNANCDSICDHDPDNLGCQCANPNRSTRWTWVDAAGNATATYPNDGSRNNDDEYVGTFPIPGSAGSYYFTMRFSVDGGLTWTACDEGGANGRQTFDTLNGVGENYRWQESGELTVRDFQCQTDPNSGEDNCPLAENETCFNQCDDDLADANDFGVCVQYCQVDGCPDPLDGDNVVYVSQDPNECAGVDLSDCSVVTNGVSFSTHCGCGCINPAVVPLNVKADMTPLQPMSMRANSSVITTPAFPTTGSATSKLIARITKMKIRIMLAALCDEEVPQCNADEFTCSDDSCISLNLVCDDVNHCPNGEDEDRNNATVNSVCQDLCPQLGAECSVDALGCDAAGLRQDADGCDTCECVNAPQQCPDISACNLQCEFGRDRDANDCEMCVCVEPEGEACPDVNDFTIIWYAFNDADCAAFGPANDAECQGFGDYSKFDVARLRLRL